MGLRAQTNSPYGLNYKRIQIFSVPFVVNAVRRVATATKSMTSLSGWAVVLLLALPLTGGAIDVEPWRTELKVPPGEKLEGTLKVRNERPESVVMLVSFRDLSIGERKEDGWIVFPTEPVALGPNETAHLSYSIHVPDEAAGEYFGRVGFVEQQVEGRGAVSVRTKISVPIYVVIEGTEKYEASIEDVRVLKTDPLSMEVLVNNTGNVHLRARGDCAVIDQEDDVVIEKLALNEQGFPIYPGRVNRIVCRAGATLDPGSYDVAVRLPFPDPKNLIERTFRITIPEK